ncbi:MAG TPA: TolC family protein, partial [Candidatus Solibacter sp.]|nr:TolC family protein [Candidatus Solibacter sp.]
PFLLFVAAAFLRAQSLAPVSPSQAVEAALKNYPSIRVSQEQIQAASAAITLARTAYLPRVDALGQVNRATRNNVFGLLMPQSVIPPISGPVLGTNNFGTVWGSALGGLVTWEPFDFGLRRANTAVAEAARAQSEAALKRSQFEIAVSAADAYLTIAAAQDTVRAAQAGVDRAETVLKTIGALVDAQLRPGADRSRAEAEVAAARTQLIQAQSAVAFARATLAQFTGGDPAGIAISAPALVRSPAGEAPTTFNATGNPRMVEQSAAIEQARAQLKAIERSYFPRFYAQLSAYARGTGAEVNGVRHGGANGLAPTVANAAAGFSVTFPILDRPAIRAREAQQSATIRAQSARAEQIATELRGQWNRAIATYDGARRVAANTPVQTKAARDATDQATARYRSGLANIDEVAEAQRLLTQSEIDDALARLNVWRALLAIATATGNLDGFLAEVSQ